MNYRVLFLVSLFILFVGVVGLFMFPSGGEDTPPTEIAGQPNETPAPKAEKPAERLITVAQLTRDIAKGTLLQAGDYQLSELNVAEDSPLINNDLKSFFETSKTQSLQGHLMAESVKAESFISPAMVISPKDSRFLVSSLDPKQEVAYRIYVQPPERYILDTVSSGTYVSIYSQQNNTDSENNGERMDLVKLADNLLVLQVNIYEAETEGNQGTENDNFRKDYLGYVNVKINAEQVKSLYTLDKAAKLIVLPSAVRDENINRRGALIRNIRGNGG